MSVSDKLAAKLNSLLDEGDKEDGVQKKEGKKGNKIEVELLKSLLRKKLKKRE